MTVPAGKALRRLLPYYHPYRLQVAAGLVMVVTGAALSNLIPGFLKQGIDAVAAGSPVSTLYPVAWFMLACAVLSGIMRFGMRQLLNGVSRRIETDIRHDVFSRVLMLDAGWFVRWRTGDLMARLTNDLSAVRMASGPAIMYLVNTVAGGLFAMIMMIRIDAQLTLFALLPMLGLPMLMLKLGSKIHRSFEAVQEQFGLLTTRAQENLAGVRVVRAYRQENAETARFASLGDAYLEANMSLAKLNGLMHPGFALLAGMGTVVTLAVGGRLLINGSITIGEFVAFTLYLAMLMWPMIALGWTTNLLQRGAASMSRVLELIDAQPYSVNDNGSASLPAASGGRTIEFKNVWFRYPSSGSEQRWVLRDVSFTIEAGSTLAIVGATGSGKSALVDLIPRFFDAERGTVLIDGIDIRSVPVAELRQTIGYVPQETLLFSETIGANVGYGLSNDASLLHATAEHAAISRSAEVALPEMVEAARIAQLSDTVAMLPNGFETRLGERGINLSGGQKQRTALARALARNPDIVLLDDALSAVDTHTEAAILNGLKSALDRRTAVIVSHRVSTVRHADYIIVLDEGAIVERGTHEQLAELNGRYANLLRRQQLLDDLERV